MSAKKSNKPSRTTQWHSWRPGWMSTLLILFVILLGAVLLLVYMYNPKALNVASITGAKAASFSCSRTLSTPTTSNGYVHAPVSFKCNKNYFVRIWVMAYNSSNANVPVVCNPNGIAPGCGLSIPPLTYASVPHDYFAGGYGSSYTAKFLVTTVNGHSTTSPCKWKWVTAVQLVQNSDHSIFFTAYSRHSTPSC